MKVFPALLISSLVMSGTVLGFMSMVDNPLNAKASFLFFGGVSLITVSGIAIFDKVRG